LVVVAGLSLSIVGPWSTAIGPFQVVAASSPDDESIEAGFARDMSIHHAQAVEMSFIILERGTDSAVRLLATDILSTQQHQIGQMYAWLDLWDLPQASFSPAMAWMGHPVDGPMPGMATRDEVHHLASLSGLDADREFLRLVIRHHQGGAPMADAALAGTDEPHVTRLASAIGTFQTAEVRTMEAMLAALGGASLATPTAGQSMVHGLG